MTLLTGKKGCVSIVCVQISKRRARMWSTPPPNIRNEWIVCVVGLRKARVQVWGARKDEVKPLGEDSLHQHVKGLSDPKRHCHRTLFQAHITSQHKKKVQHNILVITRGSLLWVWWSGFSGSSNDCLYDLFLGIPLPHRYHSLVGVFSFIWIWLEIRVLL